MNSPKAPRPLPHDPGRPRDVRRKRRIPFDAAERAKVELPQHKPWYFSKRVWLGLFQVLRGAINRNLRSVLKGLAMVFLRQSIGSKRRRRDEEEGR